jgi:hypothetical protein
VFVVSYSLSPDSPILSTRMELYIVALCVLYLFYMVAARPARLTNTKTRERAAECFLYNREVNPRCTHRSDIAHMGNYISLTSHVILCVANYQPMMNWRVFHYNVPIYDVDDKNLL